MIVRLFLIAGIAVAPTRAALAQDSGYHVIHRIPLGGEGGWDYLLADTTGHRLYVSHGTHVTVLDLDSLKVVGDIPNTPGVHGIAVVPAAGRGFTSNGRDTTVSVFDLKTLAVVDRIRVTGANPDAITYDPSSARVFTFNGRGANATAIDPVSGKVVGTVTLSGKPEAAIADGQGRMFVNLEDAGSIAVFDTRSLQVQQTWPLTPCEEPTGLAYDPAHQRLFCRLRQWHDGGGRRHDWQGGGDAANR